MKQTQRHTERVEHSGAWEARLTEAVVQRIKHQRKQDSLSAEGLAARCRERGYPLQRNTIANLESGRRETITLGEFLALAKALDAHPLSLLLPVGDGCLEILPGITEQRAVVASWLIGPEITDKLAEAERRLGALALLALRAGANPAEVAEVVGHATG